MSKSKPSKTRNFSSNGWPVAQRSPRRCLSAPALWPQTWPWPANPQRQRFEYARHKEDSEAAPPAPQWAASFARHPRHETQWRLTRLPARHCFVQSPPCETTRPSRKWSALAHARVLWPAPLNPPKHGPDGAINSQTQNASKSQAPWRIQFAQLRWQSCHCHNTGRTKKRALPLGSRSTPLQPTWPRPRSPSKALPPCPCASHA